MKQPRRVLVDGRMLYHSGVGVHVQRILERLVRWHGGTRFTVYVPTGCELPPWCGSANVHPVPWRAPIYGPEEQICLSRWARYRGDVAWFPHFNVASLCGMPWVATVHDCFHLANRQLYAPHEVMVVRALFAALRRRARGICFVSEWTRAEFKRLVGGVRCPSCVVGNGVDAAWRGPHGAWQRPRPYFVAVSNVKPHKNLAFLVRAFAQVCDAVGHDLVIVGKREGFVTADRAVAETARQLGDRVVFTGFLPDAELRACVAGATAMVFPSIYEGFGLPPLEAMAAGTPVLASDIPPVREACGSAVLWFDPQSRDSLASAMRRIVADADLATDLERRGRTHVAAMTWDAPAQRTWAMLCAAVSA